MTTVRRIVPEFTSFALVVSTATVGLVFAPTLPEQMIIGWHLGLNGQISVTRGPRLLGLVAIPAVTTTLYVILRVARLLLDGETTMNARLFEILAHLLLGTLALGQMWLLTVNL